MLRRKIVIICQVLFCKSNELEPLDLTVIISKFQLIFQTTHYLYFKHIKCLLTFEGALDFLAKGSNSVPVTLCLEASYVFLFFLAVLEQISSCTWRRSAANRRLQNLQVARSSRVTADCGPLGFCFADGLFVEGARPWVLGFKNR